mmetsp:Transcript_10184/g.14623  ORF Transcript_10184/g.14623 Transcript_10184/m.14623 type:complete len:208 (-) Transcript_10184:113-736(-)
MKIQDTLTLTLLFQCNSTKRHNKIIRRSQHRRLLCRNRRNIPSIIIIPASTTISLRAIFHIFRTCLVAGFVNIAAMSIPNIEIRDSCGIHLSYHQHPSWTSTLLFVATIICHHLDTATIRAILSLTEATGGDHSTQELQWSLHRCLKLNNLHHTRSLCIPHLNLIHLRGLLTREFLLQCRKCLCPQLKQWLGRRSHPMLPPSMRWIY